MGTMIFRLFQMKIGILKHLTVWTFRFVEYIVYHLFSVIRLEKQIYCRNHKVLGEAIFDGIFSLEM